MYNLYQNKSNHLDPNLNVLLILKLAQHDNDNGRYLFVCPIK